MAVRGNQMGSCIHSDASTFLQEQKDGFIQTELLIGIGAGLILPSYYELARKHVFNSGEPLILPPPSEIKLIAHDYAGLGSYTLNWGDPYSDYPVSTI